MFEDREQRRSEALSFQSLLAQIRNAPDLSTEAAVFDLDNTILIGDIGDAVFDVLDRNGRLLAQPIDVVDPVTGQQLSHHSIPERERDESLNEYYGRMLRHTAGDADVEVITGSIYLWMTKCLSGLSIGEVTEATAEAWRRFGPGGVERGRRSVDARPEMIELISALRERGARVCVVSASNQISVSWVTEHVINPHLRNGAIPPIGLADVYGVRAKNRDRICTSDLIFPTPTFRGKAAIVRSSISPTPYLVAGDSPNDFAMLTLARYPLLIDRCGSTVETRSILERFKATKEQRPAVLEVGLQPLL